MRAAGVILAVAAALALQTTLARFIVRGTVAVDLVLVVVVYLADGELKSTTPEGKVDVNPISFGLTKFNRPNRSHTEEVVKGSARAIIVELK